METKLYIYVDVSCHIYCDFQFCGKANPQKAFEIELEKGTYLLEYKRNDKVVFSHMYNIKEGGKEETIKVCLVNLWQLKGDKCHEVPSTLEAKYLFIDTETTGLPKYPELDLSYQSLDNWPYIVQIGILVFDENKCKAAEKEFILSPDNYKIPSSSTKVHKITNEYALKYGQKRENVLIFMDELLSKVDYIIGHNVEFDINVLKCEILRIKGESHALFLNKEHTIIDTMKLGTNICCIPSLLYDGFKYPTLNELYHTFFGKGFEDEHNALSDIKATFECFKAITSRFPNVLDDSKEDYWKYVESSELEGLEDASYISVQSRGCKSTDGTIQNRLSMCFTMEDGRKKYIPISQDSELRPGDEVDANSVEVLTFEKNDEEIYRVDGDIIDEEESGWELFRSQRLTGINNVTRIFVVNKNYRRLNGHVVSRKSMCFIIVESKRYIPLCKDSKLEIADEVDIDSVMLYIYKKNGYSRYGVDGDCLKKNLGYADAIYTDISDYKKSDLIKSAYTETKSVPGSFRWSNFLCIELINGEKEEYPLQYDSYLQDYDLVAPDSIMIFTYERDGEERQYADGVSIY